MLAAPKFAANGWQYGGWGNESHVPDVEELAHSIERLIERVVTEGHESMSSGRFFVQRDGFWGISVRLQLGALHPEDGMDIDDETSRRNYAAHDTYAKGK